MISSAEPTRLPAFATDFLAFTLSGERPDGESATGLLPNGVRYAWWDEGVLLLEPATHATHAVPIPSLLVSAGIHGDETAPIELLSRIVADIAYGTLPVACRLLIVLGNVGAMRAACRYRDDDLNRLFCGRYAQFSASVEASRAAALEALTQRFFSEASANADDRWHIDMHTAIRSSLFEQFALLPYTDARPSSAMFGWLASAHMAAVLLHTSKSDSYTHFTAQTCRAQACTLELGKVRPFGHNDLTHFFHADRAVREKIAHVSVSAEGSMPRVFTVIGQITKRSEAFEWRVAPDVPNFTPFTKGTVLARDNGECYVVQHDEERIVFPNPAVKPGLRAGLMVIETEPFSG